MRELLALIERHVLAPRPISRLVVVRIAASLAILGFMSSRIAHADDWLSVAGFRVPEGEDWRQPLSLPALPVWLAWAVGATLAVSGLATAVGFATRWASGVFAVLLVYVALADRLAAFTVSKLAPVVALALCLTPSGARCSLDAWLVRRSQRAARGQNAPPAKGETLRAKAEKPPAKAEKPPAKGETLPAKAEKPPAPSASPPAKGETLPKGEKPPAPSASPPAKAEKLPALPDRVSGGCVAFFQFLLPVFYFASGRAKWLGDWRTDDFMLWTHIHDSYQTWLSWFIGNHLPLWMWTVLQKAVLVFEYGAPLWFALPWTRPYALVFGVGMHLMIGLMFGPVIWFSLLMMTLLVASYAPAAWLGRVVRMQPGPPARGA